MRFAKPLLDKSAKTLLETAENCLDLAKTQHEIAATQQNSAKSLEMAAKKLDTLGRALIAEAVEIKGETEIVAARASPPLHETPKPPR